MSAHDAVAVANRVAHWPSPNCWSYKFEHPELPLATQSGLSLHVPVPPHAWSCQAGVRGKRPALMKLTLPLDRGGTLRLELKERSNMVA